MAESIYLPYIPHRYSGVIRIEWVRPLVIRRIRANAANAPNGIASERIQCYVDNPTLAMSPTSKVVLGACLIYSMAKYRSKALAHCREEIKTFYILAPEGYRRIISVPDTLFPEYVASDNQGKWKVSLHDYERAVDILKRQYGFSAPGETIQGSDGS